MTSDRPGLYQHYRGDFYRLLHIATVCRGLPPINIGIVALFGGSLSEDRTERFGLMLRMSDGQLYVVINRPSELYPDGSKVAVYVSLLRGSIWARPLTMWSERVELVPGSYRDRFEFIGQTLPELTP